MVSQSLDNNEKVLGNQCIPNTYFLFESVKPFPNIQRCKRISVMKARALALISLIVIIATIPGPTMMPIAEAQDVSDVNVLMIVTEAFGWNYFDAKSILESWGVNVTTIAYALDTNVTGCFNRPHNWTIADLLLSDVENDIVTQFDVLFIPSGGHWAGLIASTRVLDFISYAHEHGVIIATTCIGNRVIAESNGIVNGTSVVNYDNPNSYYSMVAAGARIRYGYEAVCDNGIITGNEGGGPTGGGYIEAPTSEICLSMVREALGYSYLQDASVEPLSGEAGSSFEISVNVTDLDTELGSLSVVNLNISEVNARIYTAENRTLIETVELVDPEGDWTYEGVYLGDIDGEYVIDIEIEDTNSTLEIEREVLSITVGDITTTTGLNFDPMVIGGIIAGGVGLLVIVIIIRRR